MTAIRSAMVNASRWSWVTMIVVMPSWRSRIDSSTCICSRKFLSSALSASSSSSITGRTASARAMATRCCWPPLSSDG